ncbi:MAG: rhodanese-like domain-containing protein [Luteibaculum sp.]
MKNLLFIVFGLFLTQQAPLKLAPKNFQNELNKTEHKILLDVRTPKEWAAGTIKGAQMINFFEEGFDTKLARLDKEKSIFVYCKAGGRSAKTVDKLKKQGFEKIVELEGGMDAWKAAGLSTINP